MRGVKKYEKYFFSVEIRTVWGRINTAEKLR